MSDALPAAGVLPDFDPALNHFARLGLEASFDVDREALEANYLQRSAAVHPDRHRSGGEGLERLAMEHASAINVAYRVLRDPVSRAEYLVKLGGIDLDSSDEQGGAPKPTQAFLVDMIERREQLEEAADEGVEALEDLRDELDDEARAVFRRAGDALREGNVSAAAIELVTRRYLARLESEIEARIEGEDR